MAAAEGALEAAQALLTAFDTTLSRQYREEERSWRAEDRSWRREDIKWREEEREWRHLEADWRDENRRWRVQDIEQRTLENGRWVWLRFVEKNRRDVEEKAEQLKAVSNLAALIAGFAVVAFVELQFHELSDAPSQSESLIALYGVSTALTVGLNLNAMVLCSLMLSSILRNGKQYVSDEEESDYLFRCRRFAAFYKPGDRPPVPKRTFAAHWETRCEDDWRLAFRMFSVGVPLFLCNLVFAAWLKFHYSHWTAGLVTAVMLSMMLFWLYIHYTWAAVLLEGPQGLAFDAARGTQSTGGLPFDWHARPLRHPATNGAELNAARAPQQAPPAAEPEPASPPSPPPPPPPTPAAVVADGVAAP